MTDETPTPPPTLTNLTSFIVTRYAAANSISAADLPGLIKSVYNGLATAGGAEAPTVEETVKPTAAQIRRSITPDALISFLDGKGYKTLKRHLTTNGLTIDGYKAKFGLPSDYPTTAPSYSERRSAMAKSLGLGRKAVPEPVVAPVKRGRAKRIAPEG